MKKAVAATLLFLLAARLPAQECAKFWSHDYAKSYIYSGLAVVKQPLEYNWKSWAAVGGAAAVATLSFVYDNEIHDYFSGHLSADQADKIHAVTDVFGEEYFQLPATAALYALSAIGDDCRMRTASLSVLQAFVYAEVVTAGIKVLSCRLRPETAESQWDWDGPFASFSSSSFVSGHAARSFAFAAAIDGAYRDCPWVGAAAYTLATASALGRVICSEHWCSDVVVGAAIGYFIGRGVSRHWQKVEVASSAYGIRLSYKL